MTYTPPPPGDVDEEIEIFRKDEESAQQTFFAYIGIRDLIARRPDVHAAINHNAMFWLTTHRALFVSTFVGLGRIFDQDSAHNLDRLLSIVGRNIPELGRDALRQRKEQVISAEQAAEYVKEKHETTAPDVRALRKEVDQWRKIYAPVYGEIRHHLAHNKGATEDLDALLARTDIEEMKRMFGFLHALHEGLRELHLNGRNPLPLPEIVFVLPPDPKPQRQYHPGEKAFREAQAALLSMLPEESR
jgi:AbiU2